MSQLRKDPVTKRWVIITSDRELRVEDMPWVNGKAPPNDQVDRCPFCPGREEGTPPEVVALRGTAGWQARVVPNKFPALRIEGDLRRTGEGIYDRMSGIGAHEVIIEHPDHYASFATFTVEDVERVLWCYRERSLDLRRDRRFKYLLIFKNSGTIAGASLEHPHSQLIATPVVPKRVVEELNGADSYFSFKERCAYCDIVHQEVASRSRVVAENDEFVVFTPFASRFPFELMLLPKQHLHDFGESTDQQLRLLSIVMKESIGRLLVCLKNPPYNYILHTCPVNGPVQEGYHWHMEIIPRLTRVAGFEWGSGFYVNPVAPEEACAKLRGCQP